MVVIRLNVMRNTVGTIAMMRSRMIVLLMMLMTIEVMGDDDREACYDNYSHVGGGGNMHNVHC